MIKKIIALVLSFLMLSSGVPSFAAAKNGPLAEISKYFDVASTLPAQKSAKPQEPEKNTVTVGQKPAPAEGKVAPFADLKTYFDNNEQLSATGILSDFDRKQQELAAYIRNSNWRTKKGLSKSDRAFVSGLVEMGKFALMWTAAIGFDGLLDAMESNYESDNDWNASLSVGEDSVASLTDMLEAVCDEDLSVDKLYAKIQHNAFYLVIIDGESFKQVASKYPEVAYLFEDLYTFFRWRYELRSRVSGYGLNEDNINVTFRAATSINSFIGWWELANVAKSEMALAVANPDDYTALIPFSVRSGMEERTNIRELYKPRARRARYYGRVWNNIQDYAAKKRHMEKISEQEKSERGINSVAKPVRGRRPSVRKAVFNTLAPLSDREVYQTLTDMRQHYVEVRVRSERVWQQYMQEQVIPMIKEPAVPAWKEAQQAGVPAFKAEDFLQMLQVIAAESPTENTEEAADEAAGEAEQNAEDEQVDDENEPDESEIESENEGAQELADQVTQELKGRFTR